MAKAGKSKAITKKAAAGLSIGLYDPGMTPWFRAGLGGLAASVYAMAQEQDPRAPWPRAIEMGPGRVLVEAESIGIDFGGGDPGEVLRALFEQSFRLDGHGLIVMPGAYDATLRNRPEMLVELQSALRASILNHPTFVRQKGDTGQRVDRSLSDEDKKAQKAAKKAAIAASRGRVSFSIDERPFSVAVSGLSSFAHRDAHVEIGEAISKGEGTLQLSSWAYPGATKKHIAFNETELEYTPAQAICACFALVGVLVYPTRQGGAIVVPEPLDLLAFAELRAGLTPQRLDALCITGLGDALLSMESALRMRALEHKRYGESIGRVHGILIGSVAWDANRKVRVGTLTAEHFSKEVLALYDSICRTLASTIRPVLKEDKNALRDYYVTRSALRAFVTQNIAQGQKWYKDFARATDGEDKPRYIHYFRDKDNKGALYPSERKGLIEMTKHLSEAEGILVESVHVALKHRFGAIAEESKDNPVAMRNRFQGERDKWRIAFSGSKTPDQIRGALADLFSRGGSNKALRAHWKEVLPLLSDPQHWQLTRDLALVALASYQGDGASHEEGDGAEDHTTKSSS